ncbi:MAG: APC family permease [Promethearchaeota archaeon]
MTKSNEVVKSDGKLIRQLGLFDSTMMMIGIIVGSGIFLTTGIMAKSLPSAGLIMVAWLIGGLLTLAGALVYAELGVAMPEAGGQYVYLREAYSPLSGFLFGWITFLVYISGSIAALSSAFAEYFGYFFPTLSTNHTIFSTVIQLFNHDFHFSLSSGQVVATIVILLLSAINYIGVGLGKIIQNIFTVLKIGIILIFIVLGLAVSKATTVDFSLNPTGLSFSQIAIGLGVALVAVSWTFDGWNNINFVAGEIKDPKRSLPKVLIIGTSVVTIFYLFVNYIYFRALPIQEMTGVVRIAESASSALYGTTTTGILSAAILISVFGALNATIFVGPRVYFAMAKDKVFFKRAATIHPRFKTPSFAIVIQAVWACILTLTGTFEQLFTYVIFVAIIFWIAATTSIFTLRKKYPDLPRPYKAWGYPVVPIIFIAASVGILINTLLESPVESLAGLGFIVVGIPVYYYWKRKG